MALPGWQPRPQLLRPGHRGEPRPEAGPSAPVRTSPTPSGRADGKAVHQRWPTKVTDGPVERPAGSGALSHQCAEHGYASPERSDGPLNLSAHLPQIARSVRAIGQTTCCGGRLARSSWASARRSAFTPPTARTAGRQRRRRRAGSSRHGRHRPAPGGDPGGCGAGGGTGRRPR